MHEIICGNGSSGSVKEQRGELYFVVLIELSGRCAMSTQFAIIRVSLVHDEKRSGEVAVRARITEMLLASLRGQ